MKHKRITALLLALLLTYVACAKVLLGVSFVKTARANETYYTSYSGTNVGYNDYQGYAQRWATPITSYLVDVGEQRMLVQAGAVGDKLVVEYFDSNFTSKNVLLVNQELPIFGGFYASGDYYYVVTGQTNTEESATVECFRITKYNTAWEKIAHASLADCNTTVPFDASSLRFAEYGDYLLIRTGHEMYTASDGYNHQANVTIQVDTTSMTITDSYTDVMNNNYGYVSHSFNQFIAVDGKDIVAVDHGDAYPRSVVLILYNSDVSDGTFTPTYSTRCNVVDLHEIAGSIGDNETGVGIGGLVVTEDSYLVAYNSVVQDDNFASYETRNVYLSVYDKATGTTIKNQVTALPEGQGTATTPHLIDLQNGSYMLLYSIGETVYYQVLDSQGVSLGQYSMEGSLSDCVPVVSDGKVIWYTLSDTEKTFYQINLNNYSSEEPETVENSNLYSFVVKDATTGLCERTCIDGTVEEVYGPVDYDVWWKVYDAGYYSSAVGNVYCNAPKQVWISLGDSGNNAEAIEEYTVTIADPSVVSYSITSKSSSGMFGTFTPLKAGTTKVTFTPVYNPTAAKTYTLTVKHEMTDGCCIRCGEFEDGVGARLAGYSLSLAGNIGVNFYMALDTDVLTDENAYMQFTLPNGDTQKILVGDAQVAAVEEAVYFVFSCEVAAKEMRDDIKAQIVLGDATKGTEYTYTVSDYANYILENETAYSEETVELVNALMTYGTCADAYFDAGVTLDGETAAAVDTAFDSAGMTGTSEQMTGTLSDGITYYGTSLLLKTRTTLRHYFTIANGKNIADYSFELGGVAVTPVAKESYYYVELQGINAVNLGQGYTLSVDDEAWTYSYSVLNYVSTILNDSNSDAELQSLMKALALYHLATLAYES